jgi:hypothetical protein
LLSAFGHGLLCDPKLKSWKNWSMGSDILLESAPEHGTINLQDKIGNFWGFGIGCSCILMTV